MLYTFIQLVHFPCTISVILLYNDTNCISFLSYVSIVGVFNHIFNGLVEKMVAYRLKPKYFGFPKYSPAGLSKKANEEFLFKFSFYMERFGRIMNYKG